MNLFRLLLLFLLLPGASSYAGGDARQEKMCWAHYVGWGFNQSDGYALWLKGQSATSGSFGFDFVVKPPK